MAKTRQENIDPDGLNPQQRRFVEAFMKEPVGKTAAIAAGYSAKSAEVTASVLLSNPKVRAALEKAQGERAMRVQVELDEVLLNLLRLLRSDLRKAFDENGSMLHPQKWPDDLAAAISSVEVLEEFAGRGDERELIGYTKKLKLWDKTKAIELLMKHLGALKEKVQHDLGPTFADLVIGSMKPEGED